MFKPASVSDIGPRPNSDSGEPVTEVLVYVPDRFEVVRQVRPAQLVGLAGAGKGSTLPPILAGLQARLMEPARFEQFAKAFVAETNRQHSALSAAKAGRQAALARVERQIKRLVDAIVEGADAMPLNAKLKDLDTEKARLAAELEAAPDESRCFILRWPSSIETGSRLWPRRSTTSRMAEQRSSVSGP